MQQKESGWGAKLNGLGSLWAVLSGFPQVPRGHREGKKPQPSGFKVSLPCPLGPSNVLFYLICCFYHAVTWCASQHQRTLLYCDIFKWKLHGSNSFPKSVHLAWQHFMCGREKKGGKKTPTLHKTGALSKTVRWLFSKQALLLEWQRGRLHIQTKLHFTGRWHRMAFCWGYA